jgi:hypothetical protein
MSHTKITKYLTANFKNCKVDEDGWYTCKMDSLQLAKLIKNLDLPVLMGTIIGNIVVDNDYLITVLECNKTYWQIDYNPETEAIAIKEGYMGRKEY